MQITGFVEISEQLDERILGRLVEGAYTASRDHPVMLAFAPELRERVEKELDRMVERLGTGMAGVAFTDPAGEIGLELALAAPLVIATSPDFRSRLAVHGITSMGAQEGLGVLLRADGVPPSRARTSASTPTPRSGRPTKPAGVR